MRTLFAVWTVAFLFGNIATAEAASHDNNVEWDGVSHVIWQDLRPVCPETNEAFSVRFQTWDFDITSARVRMDDGGLITWKNAYFLEDKGPYDVWQADLDSSFWTDVNYVIELTDGTDTDFYGIYGMTDTLPADTAFTVDYVRYTHAPYGAVKTTNGAVFRTWAPGATSARTRGDFNGWTTVNPLQQWGNDWIARVGGVADRDNYKLYFNDGASPIWKTDAHSRSINAGDNNNSIVEDPSRYVWNSNSFVTPALEEMIIYQVHVGTFAGRNDPHGTASFPSKYVDVADRAYQLAELGINAVQVCPINEFPGDESAGYNPIGLYAPEWIYGTPDQFKEMVDSLHAHGIAVLLDIVFNHFSDTDNFLWQYDGTQIFFDDPAVGTPWGSQADFDKPEVRDYYIQNAMMWLEDYRIDGFRMDATDFMNIAPQEAAGWFLMQEMNDMMDWRYADRVSIAEQLPDDDFVTRPVNIGGAGFDSQYYDQFTDDLRQEIFDAALGDPEMWKISNVLNGGGAYLSGAKALHYLELHDEAWPSSGGQRIVKTIDGGFPHDDMWAKGRVKLGQGVVMFSAGVPALLQGSEWLEDTDFGTSLGNRIDWSKKITYAPIYQYMKDIIGLRRTNSAFRANAGIDVYKVDEANNVIVWQRFDGSGNVAVVVANFGNANRLNYRIGMPSAGTWYELINSQALVYDGNGLGNGGQVNTEGIAWDGQSQSAVLTVPQMGVLVFSQTPPIPTDVPTGPAPQLEGLRFESVRPNPARAEAIAVFHLPASTDVRMNVFDIRGRLVARLANETFPAGRQHVVWDGRANSGERAPAGIYFLKLESGESTVTKKLILLK